MSLHILNALACALLWAGSTVASKAAASGVSVLQYSFLRYLISTICLLPFVSKKEMLNLKLRSLPMLFILGMSAVVIFNLFYFTAFHYTTATTVALILAMHPLITLLTSALISGKKPSNMQLIAFVCSFVGVGMIITQGKVGREIFTASSGEFLMLGAVLCQVIYTLLLKKMSRQYSPLFLSAATGISGVLFLLPFCLTSAFLQSMTTMSSFDWLMMAYIGIPGTALGLWLYSKSVRELGASIASLLVFSTLPIFAFFIAYFTLGDSLSIWKALGGLCVIASLILGMKKQ